jgi:hypothetical protein
MTDVTHMARFRMPGALFNEDQAEEIRAPQPDLAAAIAPRQAFAFTLYERPVVDFEFDTRRFRVVPIPQNESRVYYIGPASVWTQAEIRIMVDSGKVDRTLLANMEGNGWERVVRTRLGNWQPFEDGDVILDSDEAP